MDSVPIDVKFFQILSGKENPLEILKEYEETCLSLAKSSSSESGQNGIKQFVDKKQKQISQEESNTWLLWKIIQENVSKERNSIFDASTDPLVGFNCSKKSLAQCLENSNLELNKTYSVKQWLQEIYWRSEGELIQKINFDLSNQSMWLLEKKETVISSSSEQHVDQEKLIDPNGILVLCEKAWSLVRSGREADAINLFEGHNQAWRAAMMFGNQLPSDSHFDKEESSEKAGNAYYNLFKKTLLSILDESTSDLNLFERAIMGTQAAHLKSILGACRTWEDYLWAHYYVKHEAQKNLELENFMKLKGSYLDEDDSSVTHPPICSEGEIFAMLQSCEDKVIREMSFAPFHYIQSCIILSLYDALIETLAMWAKKLVLDLGTVAGEGELIQNLAAKSQHLDGKKGDQYKNEEFVQSLSTLATILTVEQGALFVEGSIQHRVPNSILRFSVHLVIYLDRHLDTIWQFTREDPESEDIDSNNVLNAAAIFQAYASYLSTVGQLKLVPYYLSFFPNLTVPYTVKFLGRHQKTVKISKNILFSTSTYATLLLRDPQVVGKEKEYLKVARDNGLDTLAIMSHVVDLLLDSFDDNKKNYNALDEKEAEILDNNLIQQLKWLSYDEMQSFEILNQSNRLVRKFLVNGRPKSAKATFTYLEKNLNLNYRTTLEQWISDPNLTLNNVATLFHANNQNSPAFVNGKPLVNSEELKQKFIDTLTQLKSEPGFKTEEQIDEMEREILRNIKREFIEKNNRANLEQEMANYIKGVEIQNAIREHLSLYSYLHVLVLFEHWTILTNNHSFVQYTSNQEAMAKLSQNDVQLMVELETNLDKILKCSTGWLLDPPSSAPINDQEEEFSVELKDTRAREIEKIRTMVIPNALAILHDIFSFTGKITSCTELANLATDDQYKLIRCFPKQDSEDLITVILKSQIKDMEMKIKSNQ